MRDASIAVLREIGVETGGSNVQFAVNPADGRLVIIEMNPRVSRSSALASKATGFPIAKVAAKLAVGYTLDEIANDITGGATPASFEPTIDYVVTKIPRFAFEKFPGAESDADHLDEVGRRGDGDRPHVPGEPAEGAALAGNRPHRPRRGADRGARPGRRPQRDPRGARHAIARPAAAGRAGDAAWPIRRADPRRLQDRSVVPRRDPRHRRDRSGDQGEGPAANRRHVPPAQGDGIFRRAACGAHRPERSASDRRAPRAWRSAGVQAHRYLRGRVRLADRLHVFDLCGAVRRRARQRGAALGQAEGRHPGRRAKPHRPGHRVRLLLLPRLPSRSRRRATRPSWSIAIRRPSRPTTTPPTGSISSRSPPKT